jgi:4-hydroxybenzoate polyprenyltransferase/phosphoserine phosphatase
MGAIFMNSEARPLVVDLDGTLLRVDVLHEDVSAFALHRPWQAWRLVPWALQGPLELKQNVARSAHFEPETLPYNEEVLAWLREQKQSGRRLVLATASLDKRANAVAEHLGIFDDVIASGDGTNMKSARKRDALTQRFGEQGYDYIGNHHDDIEVWSGAREAHVVANSPRITHSASEACEHVGKVFRVEKISPRKLVKVLRPQQWLKNLLVFIALFTAQQADKLDSALRSLSVFVAMCLIASSVYVLNDMVDVVHDRHHPTKRNRPFASGQVDVLYGFAIFPVLLAGGFLLSGLTLPWQATVTLLCYYATTVAYTFYLKRQPVLDVITLAGLYTARIVAGAAAVGGPLTVWLLSFSGFFFLSLAMVKRVGELARLRARTEGANGAKARGRAYHSDDLELLSMQGVASSFAAAVVFALYVHEPTTAALYKSPQLLWLSVPPMVFWNSRIWLLAHRGEMHEDPLFFAARDKVSLVVGVLIVSVFVLAKFT